MSVPGHHDPIRQFLLREGMSEDQLRLIEEESAETAQSLQRSLATATSVVVTIGARLVDAVRAGVTAAVKTFTGDAQD